LAFVPDLERKRLLVIAPHVIEHREPSRGERGDKGRPGHLTTLAQALSGFDELYAGKNGLLHLAPRALDMDNDPLFGASRIWKSATPYTPTRHARRNGRDSLHHDVPQEVQRRHLPAPAIERQDGGLLLQFRVAIQGPVLLGRTMHFGGGLFSIEKSPT
jgi:CRISPR-associated protein Csb2